MNYGEVKGALKGHELVVFGSLAGAVAAWFLVFRKNPAPIVNVTTAPAPAASSSGLDSSSAAAGIDALSALAATQSDAINRLMNGVASSSATQPPASTTGPAPSVNEHLATSIGDPATNPAQIWTLQSDGSMYVKGDASGFAPYGVAYGVVQDMIGSTLWWRVDQGPYAGGYIRYHDSAWSVSPWTI